MHMPIEPLPITDYLTGVNNRREFFRLSGLEFEKVLRHKGHLSVISFEIDNFHHIISQHGYETADAILSTFAKMCAASCRKYDILGRIDEEEFALLLPRERVATAVPIAEKILGKARELTVPVKEGELGFTVSVGVVEAELDSDKSFESFMKRAESQVFLANQRGGNQVAFAEHSNPA